MSNQHVVFALQPDARNRLNTVFVTGMFIGGSAGSAGATVAWGVTGWPGVCGFGAALAGLALLLEVGGRLARNALRWLPCGSQPFNANSASASLTRFVDVQRPT